MKNIPSITSLSIAEGVAVLRALEPLTCGPEGHELVPAVAAICALPMLCGNAGIVPEVQDQARTAARRGGRLALFPTASGYAFVTSTISPSRRPTRPRPTPPRPAASEGLLSSAS